MLRIPPWFHKGVAPLLAIASIVAAIRTSPWLWLVAGPLLVLSGLSYHFYWGRKWARTHFPYMRRFYGAAGFEAGRAEAGQRSFNARNAVATFIRSVRPSWTDEEVDELVSAAVAECQRAAAATPSLESILVDSTANTKEAAGVHATIARRVDPYNPEVLAKFVIAAFVGERYGPEEQKKYFDAVLSDNAF